MGFVRLVEECVLPYEATTGSSELVEPVAPVAEGFEVGGLLFAPKS